MSQLPILSEEDVRAWFEKQIPQAEFAGKKILLVVPDQTRTAPMPLLFDSAANVDPLPSDQFSRIVEDRNVPINVATKAVIREFVKGLNPAPPEIETVVKLLSGDAKSASLKSLVPFLTHNSGQAVCEKMTGHSDPVVRFIAKWRINWQRQLRRCQSCVCIDSRRIIFVRRQAYNKDLVRWHRHSSGE